MGYSPKCCKESDTTEELSTHTHTQVPNFISFKNIVIILDLIIYLIIDNYYLMPGI